MHNDPGSMHYGNFYLTNTNLSYRWDQNFDDDSLEMAEEITEESDRILFRSENSISLDQGLDDLRVSEDKIQV